MIGAPQAQRELERGEGRCFALLLSPERGALAEIDPRQGRRSPRTLPCWITVASCFVRLSLSCLTRALTGVLSDVYTRAIESGREDFDLAAWTWRVRQLFVSGEQDDVERFGEGDVRGVVDGQVLSELPATRQQWPVRSAAER
jgi:hypothetical protein